MVWQTLESYSDGATPGELRWMMPSPGFLNLVLLLPWLDDAPGSATATSTKPRLLFATAMPASAFTRPERKAVRNLERDFLYCGG